MLRTLRPPLPELRSGPPSLTVSATLRTRGRAWQDLRAQVLARDCGRCQACARLGRVRLAAEVDHVRELADGGTDEPGNLQALCADCHQAKSEAARLARLGRGPMPGPDWTPTPPSTAGRACPPSTLAGP